MSIDEKVKFPNFFFNETTTTEIYTMNNTAKAILPSLGYALTAETKAGTIEMPVPQLLPQLRSIRDKIVG